MSFERTVVSEHGLGKVEPSEEFSQFVKQIGAETGLGSLALEGIQELVEERIAAPEIVA